MQTTVALIAAFASVAYAVPAPQVTAVISPTASAPAGCATSYSGKFEITAYNLTSTSKRDLEKRTCDAEGSLTLTLQNGQLLDAKSRVGYIASNYQFQFDLPPQTGAIYTAGWSVCSNGSLALGGSNVFYQCKSGNPNGGDSGAFYNLYDRKAFDICTPATINILPCGASSGGAAGQKSDGQPTAASATGAPVSQIGDGQPQGPTSIPAPISQIGDGQIQVPTNIPAPISQIGDGQIQVPTGAAISQITDGQIQAPTGAPISQITDGQIQAPTATAAPSGAPISQITDGQIQAPTATAAPSGAPISQISDGQIQAPTSTVAATTSAPAISQIPDGQVQAPASNATSTVAPFTGSASTISAGLVTIFGAAMAAFFL